MAQNGVRIGLFGATGGLGTEVLVALDASSLRIASIRPMATEASLGRDVEFQGELYPVETDPSRGFAGLDLVICCAPREAALDCVRQALKAEVPCIDCSGAVAESPDVPQRVARLPGPDEIATAPLISSPAGPALAWALVLAPLHARAGLCAVVGTALEAASAAGRPAIDALYVESLALFNQEDAPAPEHIGQPLAFDCLGSVGAPEDQAATRHEALIVAGLRRLLGAELAVTVTSAHVPTFVGHAAHLVVSSEAPLDAKEATDLLAQAPGVELWTAGAGGPNMRAAAGRDVVLVGRIRGDDTPARALQLWLVADPLRLAATNAVALAALRLAGSA